MPRPVPTANASLLDFVGSKVADQLQQTSDVVAERRRQKQRGTAATATAGLGTGSGPSEALFASRVDRGRLLAAPRRVPGSCPDASAAAARARAARRAPRPAGELLDAAGVGRTDAVKRHGQNKTKEAVPAAPEEDIGETKQQLIRAFEAYSCLSSEGDSEGQSALSSLEEWVVRSRTCCICIEVIRRQDSIWSCVQCAVQTHLGCVQSWASRFIKFAESQNLKDAEPWGCPNCRHSFRRSDYPSEYLCYCGKERDPRPDPWLLPHTCGDHCEKELGCGHRCKLFCHPGRCPPCPLSVVVACRCGAVRKTKRCGAPDYSCGQNCRRTLACGQHQCGLECHSGVCGPCTTKVVSRCLCGRKRKLLPCGDSKDFRCETECGLSLPCGVHKCEALCHEPGKCPPCPKEKTCACGRTTVSLRCDDAASAQVRCEHTCGKLLDCRKHRCVRRCHDGPCNGCTQVTHKSCRCGSTAKEVPCAQELLCERKCTKDRNCGRHQCHRRCCDGKCPPCATPCGRKLDCGVCRCTQVCGHSGFDSLGCELYNCPPCTKQTEVRCFCGSTSIQIPCGLPKKPPPCREICQVPPVCHHEARRPHTCHTGPCPPCDQECGVVKACGHTCRRSCHDAVKEIDVSSASWARRGRDKSLQDALQSLMPAPVSIDSVQCPPCEEQVELLCIGDHALSRLKCSANPFFACDSQCGNLLPCGNHQCREGCHPVLLRRSADEFEALCIGDEAGDDATPLTAADGDAFEPREEKTGTEEGAVAMLPPPPEPEWSVERVRPGARRRQPVKFVVPPRTDCGECAFACMRPRPAGCKHSCPWPCHFEPCPPCFEDVQARCYCGQTLLTYACCEVSSWPGGTSLEVDNPFLRCPFACHRKHDRCPHMCSAKCHYGPCPPCSRKDVTVRCHCGHLKQQLPCAEAWQNGKLMVLDCKEECKDQQEANAAAEAAAAAAAAEKANAEAKDGAPVLSPSELRERRKERKKQREEELEERRLKEEAAKRRQAMKRQLKVAMYVGSVLLFFFLFGWALNEVRKANEARRDEELRSRRR